MDLRKYFQKLREIEATIDTQHAFVSSLETSDGGREGIVTEVARELAAKLIAEGRAALASKEEKESFLDQQAASRAAAQKAEMARRLQVTIVSDSEAPRSASQQPSGAHVSSKK